MKKIILLILILCFSLSVKAEDIKLSNGKILHTSYAKGKQELAEGIANNLSFLENNKFGKSVGGTICMIHVLDNGNLALTFFSDIELENFHNQTDYVLDEHYGGRDVTSFQYPADNMQTHVTTMLLRPLKKKKFKFKNR